MTLVLSIEDDESPRQSLRDSRYSQTHNRYQVIGRYADGDADGVEWASTRADALKAAAACVGPGRYDRAEVFDTMARHGAAQLWDSTGAVIERRS